MVTDRLPPQPVPEWSEIIAKKDAEIARLRAELAEARREQHVRMGQQ